MYEKTKLGTALLRTYSPTLTPKVENVSVCKYTFLGCLGLGKYDKVIFITNHCDICTLVKEKIGATRTAGTNGKTTEKEKLL